MLCSVAFLYLSINVAIYMYKTLFLIDYLQNLHNLVLKFKSQGVEYHTTEFGMLSHLF